MDPSLWGLAATAVGVILWANARAMAAEYGTTLDRVDENNASSAPAHRRRPRVRHGSALPSTSSFCCLTSLTPTLS